MAFIPNQLPNTGLYIPTTAVYDVQELSTMEVTSPEFKELLVRLFQNTNNMALPLNQKDSGLYQTQEFVNGQVWFKPFSSNINESRSDFRMVVDFGPLPNAGLKSVAHNIPITNTYTFTRIYATASDHTGLTYIPIPYIDINLAGNDIAINVDAVNVNINTGGFNYSNYDTCYVVLEYLKN